MKNWYIVQTFSGFEQKVAEVIKEKLKVKGLVDKIEKVEIPMHEITEVKRGKRIQRKKNFFPSYVLVKMEMNKELYHMIKNIQKVTGFLGTTGTPVAVPDQEIDKIITPLMKDLTTDLNEWDPEEILVQLKRGLFRAAVWQDIVESWPRVNPNARRKRSQAIRQSRPGSV